jgi:hypothetical protein
MKMADSYIKKIKRDPDREDVVRYLDYLADTLTRALENIGEENLEENLRNKIGD